MQSIKCRYCDEVTEETEQGLPDNCVCGMFFELKDQLKEWMLMLDAEIKLCLKRTHFGRHTQCIIELQAIQHEMHLLCQHELEKLEQAS